MSKREPAKWRPMTDQERAAALAIKPGKVRYPVASPPKALARRLAAQAAAASPVITNRQAAAMWRLVHRFRRQLPATIQPQGGDEHAKA